MVSLWNCEEKKLLSFFLSVWDTKECENEGGQIIMKKQILRDVVQSTYLLGIGGKILKWQGGRCKGK